ncbi:MAG: hypothetical protein ABIX19_09495 [Gemmatimonadaceae bacterium]
MPSDRAHRSPPPAEAHPAPARGRVGPVALWFGLAGGFVAWSVQTLANLSLASHACYPRLFPLAVPTVGAMRGIVFGVSLVAFVVCLAAAATAWRSWIATRDEGQEATGAGKAHAAGHAALETGEGRTRFMALAGVIASATFVLVSLVHTISIFLVGPCNG